jgi:hypothetical protein
MANFLIQTVDGEIVHDFSWHLIQAIKYQNWFNGEEVHRYTVCGGELIKPTGSYFKEKEYIPIGSVEFVCNFINYHYGFSPKPINVPKELFKFAGREIYNKPHIGSYFKDVDYFVKSNDKFKDKVNGIHNKKTNPDGIKKICAMGSDMSEPPSYQFSEIIKNIVSEWRCFVYEDKLTGMYCYNGINYLNSHVPRYHSQIVPMLGALKGKYPCYTLDVAVKHKKTEDHVGCTGFSSPQYETVPIEVHELFSCGLYGFADYKILPQMFIRAYKNIIERGY